MNRDPEVGLLKGRLVSALGTLGLLCMSGPLLAQTLNAPEDACTGVPLEVEWTGPNGRGDTITVARLDAPPERFIDSEWTADGDPARLHTPFSPGTYELRYVSGNPREVLVKRLLHVSQCAGEWPQVAVAFYGTQIDFGDEIDTSESTAYGPAGLSIEQFCDVSDDFAWALGSMVDHMESEMMGAGIPGGFDAIARGAGAPTRASVERGARQAQEEICNKPPQKTTVQPFIIAYAYCRMSMMTPTHGLDIYIPPGVGAGSMWMADHSAQQAMVMTLRPTVDTMSTLLGSGWNEGLTMNGPQSTSTRAGYPVSQYSFEYTVGLGGSDSPMTMLGQTIKVKTSGTAWLSSEVPGMDIVRMFYERLTTEMSPQGSAMSFFGGLISNLVGMLQVGIPLQMDQTTSSKAMGAIGVKGRSASVISAVELFDFEPAWCEETVIPAEYEVTDVDQQMAESMGGQDAEQLAQSMEEYNQAMAQMSPEQRAMMEGMGMTEMMQQAMGGAGSAGSPSGGSCNMPSSAELTTSDILQSVQRHLEALGYDPGSTGGDPSLDTTIAISQFQAEKGLEVTGDVSPQLLGVLAAEVDAACP